MKKLVRDNYELILITLSLFIGSAATIWAYSNNYINAYADGVSHLNIARRVTDNLQPGIVQLGGSWLPFYHIVLLPLVQIDYLWHSGLAGSVINVICYVLSAVIFYRTIRIITENKVLSFLGAIAFILTPDVIYMATAPMTEVFTIYLLMSAFYYLLIWSTQASRINLIFASFFVFCAVLTRYEAWAFAIASIVIVSLVTLKRTKKLKYVESTVIIYALPIAFALLIWIGWNYVIFGHPLYFTQGNFSSRAYQIPLEQSGNLPTSHNITNSFWYYLQALIMTNGALYTWTSLIGFMLYYLYKSRFRSEKYWVLVTLAAPIGFEMLALYTGSTALWLPHLFPYKMYNIRYGLYGSPFVFIFLALFFSHFKKAGLWLFGILISVQLALFSFSGLPISLDDALVGRTEPNGRSVIAGADYIKLHYEGGLILAPAGALDPFIFATGLPIKTFITEGVRQEWDSSLVDPRGNAEWIVLTDPKDGNNLRDGIQRVVRSKSNFFDGYTKVFDEGAVLIYRRDKEVAD